MTSRHFTARRIAAEEVFHRLRSFSQFESRVLKLKTTKDIGDAFEIFVEAYLHTQVKMQAKNVWLVGQIPLRIRRKLKLPTDSKGID